MITTITMIATIMATVNAMTVPTDESEEEAICEKKVCVGTWVDSGVGCEGVGSGVGSGVGTGVGTGVGSGVGSGVGFGVGFGVGEGVGTGVGTSVGAGVGGQQIELLQ